MRQPLPGLYHTCKPTLLISTGMQEKTLTRHDELVRKHEKQIVDALNSNTDARQVARSLGLPLDVVRYVKRQLPYSRMRAKGQKEAIYDEQDVIAAMKRVAELNGGTVTEALYREKRRKSEPSLGRITQLYGHWNAALAMAGLPITFSSGKRLRFTNDDCLACLVACAKELGKTPSYSEYERWARANNSPSGQTVRNRLGTWLQALATAGL